MSNKHYSFTITFFKDVYLTTSVRNSCLLHPPHKIKVLRALVVFTVEKINITARKESSRTFLIVLCVIFIIVPRYWSSCVLTV